MLPYTCSKLNPFGRLTNVLVCRNRNNLTCVEVINLLLFVSVLVFVYVPFLFCPFWKDPIREISITVQLFKEKEVTMFFFLLTALTKHGKDVSRNELHVFYYDATVTTHQAIPCSLDL